MSFKRAKFRPPPLVSDYIPRPGLIERLEEGLRRPLSLVSTPAGYGKSTLLSGWAGSTVAPTAWMSLESQDDSLYAIVSGITEAVDLIAPGALRTTRARLEPEPPAPDSLAEYLLSELDAMEDGPLLLVLDDYHIVRDPEVNEFVAALVERCAGVLHLVLACRVDPPLSLTNLRADGRVTEIRQTDLRFTIEEARDFLGRALGRELDEELTRALEEKTEGWPVGLRLGALSLRQTQHPDRLLAGLPVGSQFVTDYLLAEVLDQQMPIVQEYLLRASIVERFNASLCDALLEADLAGETPVGIFDGAGFLALAERANVFLIPLDDQRNWFRFHHLFRDLLRHQLELRRSQQEIEVLERRAVDWLELHGHLTEAIEHALPVDPALALALVGRNRHDLMNREEWGRLDHWFRLLARDLALEEPELLLLRAWTLEHRHQYAEVIRLGRKAQLHLDERESEDSSSLRGEVEAILALESYMALDGEAARTHAATALRLLDPGAESIRGFSVILLSLAQQMLGDLNGARRTVHDHMRPIEDVPGTFDARLLAALTVVDWIDADLPRMALDATEYLRLGAQGRLTETVGMGNYFLGTAAYERNDLTGAERHLARIVQGLPHGDPWNLANSGFVLAAVYQAQGRQDDARRLASELSARALELRDPGLLPLTRAFEAELALRQGQVRKAIRWADGFEPGPPGPPYRWFNPLLTYARARISEGSAPAHAEATELLSGLERAYASMHAVRSRTEVLALQALLAATSGEEHRAAELLSESLRLAEPGGIIRMFLDLGADLRDLLRRIQPADESLSHARRILAAFAGDDLGISGEIELEGAKRSSVSGRLLSLGLTNRELEVLSLLAGRLSNKEIAAELGIGPGTVASHTASLYRKLDVNSRRAAVAKADALGILTRH